MKNLFLLTLLLSLFIWEGHSQEAASSEIQVSILTIGPGVNLYDKFGHSAFRVRQADIGLDEVYNYGTYDFNTPNFYGKFAKGELLYSLSTAPYQQFYRSYVAQNRSITEQTLNLSPAQTNSLVAYLHWNKQAENRDYLYDFLFDNCATRIRDVLVTVLEEDLRYEDIEVEDPKTYRQLIQQHVSWNSWGSLGMDLGIGAVTDVVAPIWDYQFLPEYVAEAASLAKLDQPNGSQPLVSETKLLHGSDYDPLKADPFFGSPLFIFLVLALAIIWVTLKDQKSHKRSRWLDGAIFFLTGLVGSILFFLWFGTQHSTTVNNYNILWGFPLSFLLFPLILRKKAPSWLARYTFLLLILLVLMVVHQFSGVQKFAPALAPLLLALAYRYWYLYKNLKAMPTAP